MYLSYSFKEQKSLINKPAFWHELNLQADLSAWRFWTFGHMSVWIVDGPYRFCQEAPEVSTFHIWLIIFCNKRFTGFAGPKNHFRFTSRHPAGASEVSQSLHLLRPLLPCFLPLPPPPSPASSSSSFVLFSGKVKFLSRGRSRPPALCPWPWAESTFRLLHVCLTFFFLDFYLFLFFCD